MTLKEFIKQRTNNSRLLNLIDKKIISKLIKHWIDPVKKIKAEA